MFKLAPDVQVYLHREPVDFRASINGLAVLVQGMRRLCPIDFRLAGRSAVQI